MQLEPGEKFATPLLAQVTVPIGEEPLTDAVHVVVEPVLAGDGEQVTEVDVNVFAAETEPTETKGMTPPGGDALTLAHWIVSGGGVLVAAKPAERGKVGESVVTG